MPGGNFASFEVRHRTITLINLVKILYYLRGTRLMPRQTQIRKPNSCSVDISLSIEENFLVRSQLSLSSETRRKYHVRKQDMRVSV